MRDQLLDIVQHTSSLGFELIKIKNENNVTSLLAAQNKNSLIMYGYIKDPLPLGDNATVGLGDLNKLSVILNIPEYGSDSVVEILSDTQNGTQHPSKIVFKNKDNDFSNEYRLMVDRLVNAKIPDIKFAGAEWHVEFKPTTTEIQRFKFQKNANTDEFIFSGKTENNDLIFEFGDHSTHSGGFVFRKNVTGSLTKKLYWPVTNVNNILSLPGEITMRFSNGGMLEIEVETDWAIYQYLIPGQSK